MDMEFLYWMTTLIQAFFQMESKMVTGEFNTPMAIIFKAFGLKIGKSKEVQNLTSSSDLIQIFCSLNSNAAIMDKLRIVFQWEKEHWWV